MALIVLLVLKAETRASYAKRYSYLSRVQNEDFRSWYGAKLREGVAPDKATRKDVESYPDPDDPTLSLWSELVESEKDPTALTLFEQGFVSHVSTRSKHEGTASWLPRLRAYQGRTKKGQGLSPSQLAKCRRVVRAILSSIPAENRPEQLPFKEVYLERSNSGLPDLVSDQRTIRDTVADEAADLVAKIESIPEGRTPRWDLAPPCALLMRTQEGGGSWEYDARKRAYLKTSDIEFAKGRPIWAYPLVVKLIEASFQQPLEDALAAANKHISWQDAGTIGEQIVSLLGRSDGYVHGMDYSRYDSTVHGEIIRVIFEEIGALFGREKLFGWIARYFIEVPILVPTAGGELRLKSRSRGVPSGSPFTSLVDSFANLCYSELAGGDWEDAIVLGDDKVEWSRLRAVPLAMRYARMGLSVSRIWELDLRHGIITVYERVGDVGSRNYADVGSVSGFYCVEYLSHLWRGMEL
jgi:hypothetical protein